MQKTHPAPDVKQRSIKISPHRIVVVGGGIAGLELVTGLPRNSGKISCAVTLVDREPAYVWKPMLHTVAAGTSDVSQQETHFIAQARDRDFHFEPGELKGLNREARKVHLGPLTIKGRRILPERDIPYDTLILAVGSQANDFGTPGAVKTVALRDVTVSSRDSKSATLKAGLEPGDRVVTAGVHSLVPGQSVKISEEAPQ